MPGNDGEVLKLGKSIDIATYGLRSGDVEGLQPSQCVRKLITVGSSVADFRQADLLNIVRVGKDLYDSRPHHVMLDCFRAKENTDLANMPGEKRFAGECRRFGILLVGAIGAYSLVQDHLCN